MNQVSEKRDHGFFFGLIAGTAVGAGLALFLAPRVAKDLRRRAEALTAKGREVRDEVADAVAWGAQTVERGAQTVERGAHAVERGAHEVERYATSAKTSPIIEARNHSAADGPALSRRMDRR